GFEPGGDVDDGHADPRRRLGNAGHRGNAGFRLDQEVVGLALRVRSALAVAGDGAADQPRVVLAQALEGEAELGERPGLEVLHEHVGPGEHGFEQFLVVVPGEVEHHRLLAAIEPDEVGALAVHDVVVVTREIALRPLDLDDARAGIGEPAGALRRSHRLLDGDDEEACEGEHAYLSPRAGRGRFPPEAGTGWGGASARRALAIVSSTPSMLLIMSLFQK